MYVRTYVCMYSMYVCMHACIYMSMYTCMYEYVCMYVCTYVCMNFSRLSGQRTIIFLNLRRASIDVSNTALIKFRPFYSVEKNSVANLL